MQARPVNAGGGGGGRKAGLCSSEKSNGVSGQNLAAQEIGLSLKGESSQHEAGFDHDYSECCIDASGSGSAANPIPCPLFQTIEADMGAFFSRGWQSYKKTSTSAIVGG